MKKFPIIMALSLGLVFGLALQGWANLDSVTNVGGSSNYTIDQVSGVETKESYGLKNNTSALTLIPYESHDGFAVVDKTKGSPLFFDKEIAISSNNPNFDNQELVFHVDNNTQFSWSDYHFLLVFDSVTPPDNLRFETPSDGDSTMKGRTLVLSGTNIVEIDFFAQDAKQNIDPGTQSTFHLNFDFDTPESGSLTFDLRQVATAVPIPAALPLFGSGLLGLGLLGWRRK